MMHVAELYDIKKIEVIIGIVSITVKEISLAFGIIQDIKKIINITHEILLYVLHHLVKK